MGYALGREMISEWLVSEGFNGPAILDLYISLHRAMARNYSNIKYETFYQANEAAKRRSEKEGVSEDYYAVYAHWDTQGIQTWRVSTHEVWLERWAKNHCGKATIGKGRKTKASASLVVLRFNKIKPELIPEAW